MGTSCFLDVSKQTKLWLVERMRHGSSFRYARFCLATETVTLIPNDKIRRTTRDLHSLSHHEGNSNCELI